MSYSSSRPLKRHNFSEPVTSDVLINALYRVADVTQTPFELTHGKRRMQYNPNEDIIRKTDYTQPSIRCVFKKPNAIGSPSGSVPTIVTKAIPVKKSDSEGWSGWPEQYCGIRFYQAPYGHGSRQAAERFIEEAIFWIEEWLA